jgi:glycerol-3-phosphate acyltransferase PlsY
MLITQYLIPSTILILTLLPLMLIVLGKDIAYVFWSLGALILALYCHRKDIKRFLNGEELRLNQSINRFLKK